MIKTIVYIIAWEYDGGGGGFDWYKNEIDRNKALPKERQNEIELASSNWRVKSFEVLVPVGCEGLITDHIDAIITELFDGAP